MHDGWWLNSLKPDGRGKRRRSRSAVRSEFLVWERALGVDSARCERLHDLRKGIREARGRSLPTPPTPHPHPYPRHAPAALQASQS